MQTTNFLEDNLEENLDDLGYGANFLDKGQRQYPWGKKKKKLINWISIKLKLLLCER